MNKGTLYQAVKPRISLPLAEIGARTAKTENQAALPPRPKSQRSTSFGNEAYKSGLVNSDIDTKECNLRTKTQPMLGTRR